MSTYSNGKPCQSIILRVQACKYFILKLAVFERKGFYDFYLSLGVWQTDLRALPPINGTLGNLTTLKTSHSSELRRAEKEN